MRNLRKTLIATAMVLACTTLTCATSASATSGMASPAIALAPASYSNTDPSTWTNHDLAAQTVFMCTSIANLGSHNNALGNGIGGIALLGGKVPAHFSQQLTALSNKGAHGVRVLVASDEEGGLIQRLKAAIYALPSQAVRGSWSTNRLRDSAKNYALRMRALGVEMSFGPVADLGIPGKFIANAGRAFSADPTTVSKDVIAWATGLRLGGVLPVIKHWPGHGNADDSHTGPSTTLPLAQMQAADMLPFNAAFAEGFKLVMVGHLLVPGLTVGNVPASESPEALAMLRSQIGDQGLIVTDALNMNAATASFGGDVNQAAIAALAAGADVALACDAPSDIVSKISSAIVNGQITRDSMVAKVRRILALKAQLGLISHK